VTSLRGVACSAPGPFVPVEGPHYAGFRCCRRVAGRVLRPWRGRRGPTPKRGTNPVRRRSRERDPGTAGTCNAPRGAARTDARRVQATSDCNRAPRQWLLVPSAETSERRARSRGVGNSFVKRTVPDPFRLQQARHLDRRRHRERRPHELPVTEGPGGSREVPDEKRVLRVSRCALRVPSTDASNSRWKQRTRRNGKIPWRRPKSPLAPGRLVVPGPATSGY
jgi:hypothetical protein